MLPQNALGISEGSRKRMRKVQIVRRVKHKATGGLRVVLVAHSIPVVMAVCNDDAGDLRRCALG